MDEPLKYCSWHHGMSKDGSRGACSCCGGPRNGERGPRVIRHIGNDQVISIDILSTHGG